MVYFIQAENGLIKIGYSGNVPRRFRELSYISPLPLKLIATRSGGQDTERFLHKVFNHSHGEWFHPNDRLIQYIYDECKIYDEHIIYD
jgi:hypothetical protein